MNTIKDKLLFWVALFPLLLAGCASSSAPSRLWLHAPGWSRAVQVGISEIADPVQVVLDEDDNLYLLWVSNENGVSQPVVTALDRELNMRWRQVLDVELTRPDQPKILWHAGALHLFWLSERGLYTAVSTSAGDIISAPQLLSGEATVSSYDFSEDADGNLVVWYAGSRREPGLYRLPLTDAGQAPTLIDPLGISPVIQEGNDGSTHLLFIHHPSGASRAGVFYAAYPNGVYVAEQQTQVLDVELSTTTVLEGPWMGIDQQDVYLFWTLLVRTGPDAGNVSTFYASFLRDQPTAVSFPLNILTPQDVSNLEYELPPNASVFKAGSRIPLNPITYPFSTKVRNLAPLKTDEAELVMAYKSPVLHEFRKDPNQIGLLFFRDGMPVENQLISLTTDDSRSPFLINDTQQRLYLTWLQRADIDGFDIYLTSTAADVVTSQGETTGRDVAQIGGKLLFGLLSGAVLAPFVTMLWGLVALALAGTTAFMRREGEGLWVQIGILLSYGITVAGYTMVKMGTFPGIGREIPFEAWFPSIATWLETPLRLGVPILITLVALWIAYHYVYRNGSKSSLYFIMMFAGIDSVLTAAVYGSVIYNLI